MTTPPPPPPQFVGNTQGVYMYYMGINRTVYKHVRAADCVSVSGNVGTTTELLTVPKGGEGGGGGVHGSLLQVGA